MKKWLFVVIFLMVTAVSVASQVHLFAQSTDGSVPGDSDGLTEQMQRQLQNQSPPPENVTSQTMTPCVGGQAGIYACNKVDLLAHISLAAMSASSGNTGWGWTDPIDGTEYAIMGLNNGTAFVDISDPENPIYLGKLPTHPGTGSSLWREFKVAGNYVYIVSDNNSGHGMQVFDLTQLGSVVNPPVTFGESAHYAGVTGNVVSSAHNIAVNADTGYAYIVGAGSCAGGLHMVNIQSPLNPTFAGCFNADGYTHDTQCVVYNGPDSDHQGDEICLNSNEDTLTIVDVTNKSIPVQLSRTPYAGSGYTHQGWLTEDQRYFLMDDELDETGNGHNTRTYMWDLANLELPIMMGYYQGPTAAIDHNLYIRGDYAYESNYQAGLRILDISDVANENLVEVAYFDTYPEGNSAAFDGTWNNYPYFESGVVVISDLDRGLFLVRPRLAGVEISHGASLSGNPGDTVTYTVSITNTGGMSDTYDLTVAGNSWTTTLSTNTLLLDADESGTFEVMVEISLDAVPGDEDVATVTAVSQTDPSTTASTELTTYVPLWEVVVGADEQALSAAPGTSITYTIDITNTGNVSDTYSLSLGDNDWDTTLSLTSLSLDAGQSDTVTARVDVPADAVAGSIDTVTVTAVGQATSASDSVELTTTANSIYGVEATVDAANQSGLPGATLTYTVQITNTGNTTDSYDLAVDSIWTAVLSSDSLTLTQGTSGSVQIFVIIPPDAAVNDTDTITVTATSQNGVGITAEVVLTAVALEAPAFHLYLPAILMAEE